MPSFGESHRILAASNLPIPNIWAPLQFLRGVTSGDRGRKDLREKPQNHNFQEELRKFDDKGKHNACRWSPCRDGRPRWAGGKCMTRSWAAQELSIAELELEFLSAGWVTGRRGIHVIDRWICGEKWRSRCSFMEEEFCESWGVQWSLVRRGFSDAKVLEKFATFRQQVQNFFYNCSS